jgi:phospholipase C
METLFGVPVPNLTPWRRSVTGDMTSALALGQPADPTVPTLPSTTISLLDPTVLEQMVVNSLLGTDDEGTPYPPPTQNVMPVQETSPPRPTPPQPGQDEDD